MSLAAFIGAKGPLLGQGGASVEVSTLEGKFVLLYFSAHWCGPCRGFTPELAKWYTATKAKRQDFEVIFVTADRDEAQFKEYFGTMPWLAIDFHDSAARSKLNSKLGVNGIPSLCVIDKDGRTVVTKDGRSGVMEDPENMPWKPATWEESVAGPLLTKAATQATTFEELTAKHETIAFYFSAHWCGPCRGFTPKLASVYKLWEGRHTGRAIPEVVFVSRDRSDTEFSEYYKEMPWVAIPFGDKRINRLAKRYEVSGIPSLIVVRTADGSVINEDAAGEVRGDAEGTGWPYMPKPFPTLRKFEMADEVIKALQTTFCVILDTKDVADDAATLATFTQAAAKLNEKYGDAAPGETKVRCMHTCEKNSTGLLTEAEVKQCPSGHELTLTPRPNARCDICRGPIKEKSWLCRECDFDRCETCVESRKRSPPPTLGLLGQVEAITGVGAAPSTNASIIIMKGRKGQRLSSIGVPEIVAAVDAFVADDA